ncbi:MAG: type II toxin-antitoxin system prevent-host-death family antitoxin [Desulfobacterales bacterium]|jgi:prevent-host-death family protein|nr:type II toxin-antitoxin system prevent-host-death family antitoxin [Desulfobacterales bacterium]
MQTLNVHEAKTKLSAVLMEVERKGETFIICRNGKPVAKIVPHSPPKRMVYHPVLSRIKIRYDPTEELVREEWGEIE